MISFDFNCVWTKSKPKLWYGFHWESPLSQRVKTQLKEITLISDEYASWLGLFMLFKILSKEYVRAFSESLLVTRIYQISMPSIAAPTHWEFSMSIKTIYMYLFKNNVWVSLLRPSLRPTWGHGYLVYGPYDLIIQR